MKLSIIVPVYNEAATIEQILERLTSTAYPVDAVEIVIVDDGSRDGTPDRIEAFRKRYTGKCSIVFHAKGMNRGKGHSLRKAIELATGEIVVFQDADLEYTPRDIPALIQPIIDDEADVVYGSRFLSGPHRVLYFWHYVANWSLTMLSNMMTNVNLTDMETGYKAFRADALRRLDLREDRFGIEPEVTARVAKARLRLFEIPISYFGRTYEEGKKITWRDGVAALYHIVRHNLR